MDTTELFLIIIITVSTILLVIIGIQLIFLLKDLRKIVKKVNFIIEGFEKVGLTVEHGFTEITGFVAGAKTLFKFIDLLHNKKNGKTK